MKPDYPLTPVRPVVETLHGVEVRDDYRWLEDGDDPEVRGWTAAQNALTRARLDALPHRAGIAAELRRVFDVTVMGVPEARGGRLFFFRREAGQNHAVLYRREGSMDGPETVVLDPNAFSQDGTVALDWHHVSPDGRLVAYGRSSGGSEESTLSVREVDTGQDLPDTIPNTRAASVAWLPDGSGFYYTRSPEAGSVPPGEESYHRKVFFHTLGSSPADDPLVFEPARMEMWPYSYPSSDDRTLFVHVSDGWSRDDLYWMPLAAWGEGAELRPVAVGRDALFSADALGDTMFVTTNEGAPRYRLMTGKLGSAPEEWRELLPEGEGVLEIDGVKPFEDRLAVLRTEAAVSRLELRRMDGSLEREVALPTLGTVSGLGGRWDGGDLYCGFQSFAHPPTVLRHDLNTGETQTVFQADLGFDAAEYRVEQVFYPSKDGTRVPMFLVHKGDLKRAGDRPTLLYGYGGFNVSQVPAFSGSLFAWLDRGGLYAVAALRGGAEYGEDWHRAGMLGNKQNVFDDFIAAGEYLVDEGYTRPGKLACQGGSNGGLLAGAAVTQRPDLWGAVVIEVPLLDMLRYHRFLIARLWIPEYGDPDEPEAFGWLRAYSPYHRVEPGVPYPPVLIMTGESDTRVDPLHARKMAALLQRDSGGGPVLLRVEAKAGHGQGKPVAKVVEAAADRWAFLLNALGVEGNG